MSLFDRIDEDKKISDIAKKALEVKFDANGGYSDSGSSDIVSHLPKGVAAKAYKNLNWSSKQPRALVGKDKKRIDDLAYKARNVKADAQGITGRVYPSDKNTNWANRQSKSNQSPKKQYTNFAQGLEDRKAQRKLKNSKTLGFKANKIAEEPYEDDEVGYHKGGAAVLVSRGSNKPTNGGRHIIRKKLPEDTSSLLGRIMEAKSKVGRPAKLGTGTLFKNLTRSLAHKPGVYDAKGLAAAQGRKSLGAKKFNKLAQKGKAKHESFDKLSKLVENLVTLRKALLG